MTMLRWMQCGMISLLLMELSAPVQRPQLALAQEPAYAKWSRLALEEAQKKYAGASIVDYRHIGRKTVAPGVDEETFKLWLKDRGREFGVYVRVRFRTADDQLVSITTSESAR